MSLDDRITTIARDKTQRSNQRPTTYTPTPNDARAITLAVAGTLLLTVYGFQEYLAPLLDQYFGK